MRGICKYMRTKVVSVIFCMLALTACKINKNTNSKAELSTEKIILDEVLISPNKKSETAVYQPAQKRVYDLIHTMLWLSFDYPHQWVYGKATLSLRAYSNPIRYVTLDAKGFTLNRVGLILPGDTLPLWFKYDSLQVMITLPREKTSKDTFLLFIDYIAKPAELPNEGGRAITDSRGLYFINPLGTDPNKPRQIWTQGETQYNSGWFPTNDVPNEKHTQDLFITIDNKDVSLSNGLLLDSKSNKNGTHTDHWQQLKPHAPYLTMMAIGNFKVIKDKWRDKEVSYYLEPDFEPYARLIFGKTPQMIEAFSKITGIDYPWDKFSQVVCRDFVSGAMENTSAVLHFEGVQHDARQHLDNPMEDIIVHELFHQWFGDYVTCESWSNITLNESFATYGEYLWNEYTYGKNYADNSFSKNLDAYLRSKYKHNVSLVRNNYVHNDDVFDVVSYQKGSWILHALRNQIGDQAFFKGMNLYLDKNKFGTADVHHLRHAMEEASGEDLNVFFNQWYFGKGHPELEANYYFDAEKKKLLVEIRQVQDSSFGVFQFNTQLAYAFDNGGAEPVTKLLNIAIKNKYELIAIDCKNDSEIGKDLKVFYLDANGNLPGVLKETKTNEAWLNQLKYGVSYPAKLRAIRKIKTFKVDSLISYKNQMITYCLNQAEEYFLLEGLNLFFTYPEPFKDFNLFEKSIIALAHHPNYARVRDMALRIMSLRKNGAYQSEFVAGLNDSSYSVISSCLYGLKELNNDSLPDYCKRFENLQNGMIQVTLSSIYADKNVPNKNAYFAKVIGKYGLMRTAVVMNFGRYLQGQNYATILDGLSILETYFNKCSDLNKASLMHNILKGIGQELETQEAKKPEKNQVLDKLKAFQAKIDLLVEG